MAGGMADCCHGDALFANELGHIVWKAWQVHSAMTAGPFIPKKRLPEDRGAKAFDFSSETNAQPLQTILVIPSGFLRVGESLWKKLQNGPVHCPGAI